MTRLVALIAAATMAAQASAQSLADRIGAVREGTVQLHFRAQPGVCANDESGVSWRRMNRDRGDWYMSGPCITGPVVVTLTRDANEVSAVRVRLATRPPATATLDLGEVPSPEAAHYLATLARHVGGRNADEALTGAAMADGYDVWPDFKQIVFDADVPVRTREQALFWIGQSDTPTANVVSLYADLAPLELREHFTFVLSQRRDDEAVDKLIDVARHDPQGSVRKQAIFWLGQSHSPKATKFFRDVLAP